MTCADGDVILFGSIIRQEVTELCYRLICVVTILECVLHFIWFGEQSLVVDHYFSLVRRVIFMGALFVSCSSRSFRFAFE